MDDMVANPDLLMGSDQSKFHPEFQELEDLKANFTCAFMLLLGRTRAFCQPWRSSNFRFFPTELHANSQRFSLLFRYSKRARASDLGR